MLILPGNVSISDASKFNKDCKDFQILNDGTKVGDYRYCNLSLDCRQIDIGLNGKAIPMEANYLVIVDKDGEITHELFCTGYHDLRCLSERMEDNKVS